MRYDPIRPEIDGTDHLDQSEKNVLLYSHDTFGLGHLRRNLAIAQRLLNPRGRCSVHLLTGSPVIHQWQLPSGLHVQPLPPVVKIGSERYASRGHGQCFGLVKGYREALILKHVLSRRPDVFIVDHAPAGMNGELLSTLSLIRRELPQTRVVLGLRDILDSPGIVRKIWRDQDVHALLEEAYDDIFVYGSRALFDVATAYEMSKATADRVRYCGHVVAAPAVESEAWTEPVPCWDMERAADRPVVLVTAGGGGDGFFLMDAYLRSLPRASHVHHYSVIVTGPLMQPEENLALRSMADGRDDVELIDYTTDLVPSLRAADLVVAMAGYNTSAEIIAERKRAILVPRLAPRAEQRIRASLLARLGVVRTIEPSEKLVEELAVAVPAALTAPPPPASAWEQLDLNGAERVSEYLDSLSVMRLAETEVRIWANVA